MLTALKGDFLEGQELREIDLQKKFKKDIASSLKTPNNKFHFEVKDDIMSGIEKVQKNKECYRLRREINKREKLIRMSDNSPACWATVHNFETNDVASNFEDDKKLRQVENQTYGPSRPR